MQAKEYLLCVFAITTTIVIVWYRLNVPRKVNDSFEVKALLSTKAFLLYIYVRYQAMPAFSPLFCELHLSRNSYTLLYLLTYSFFFELDGCNLPLMHSVLYTLWCTSIACFIRTLADRVCLQNSNNLILSRPSLHLLTFWRIIFLFEKVEFLVILSLAIVSIREQYYNCVWRLLIVGDSRNVLVVIAH